MHFGKRQCHGAQVKGKTENHKIEIIYLQICKNSRGAVPIPILDFLGQISFYMFLKEK